MGLGSDQAIEQLRALREQRLKKLGIVGQQFDQKLHVPVTHIAKANVTGDQLELEATFSDSRLQLDSYQVYINGVPRHLQPGKSIDGRSKSVVEQIQLTPGDNRIEVSCRNQEGIESVRRVRDFHVSGTAREQLFFLGFGVSSYDDEKIQDLDYAHQDAIDLKAMFESLSDHYSSIKTKIFTNGEATPDTIRQAKSFLASAGVADTVVLFVAGHGIYQDGNFYFLPSAVSLDNLPGTAVDFDAIEALLTGTRARRKLLLMDTCESGELVAGFDNVGRSDNDSLTRGESGTDRGGIALRPRIVSQARPGSGAALLHEHRTLGRYLTRDLRRRTGAIVFSSCRWNQSSYEHAKFSNGLFTEALIAAFNSREADTDNDSRLGKSELRAFVSGRVQELIENISPESTQLQTPTIDRDNEYSDLTFPMRVPEDTARIGAQLTSLASFVAANSQPNKWDGKNIAFSSKVSQRTLGSVIIPQRQGLSESPAPQGVSVAVPSGVLQAGYVSGGPGMIEGPIDYEELSDEQRALRFAVRYPATDDRDAVVFRLVVKVTRVSGAWRIFELDWKLVEVIADTRKSTGQQSEKPNRWSKNPEVAFLENFHWLTSANGSEVKFAAQFAPVVNYFGARKSPVQILLGERNYHDKWPYRNLSLAGDVKIRRIGADMLVFNYETLLWQSDHPNGGETKLIPMEMMVTNARNRNSWRTWKITRIATDRLENRRASKPTSKNDFFDLEELFDGTIYDSSNRSSRVDILKRAQRRLKAERLYTETVDGKPGPRTHHAIIAFQRSKGLPATGRLTRKTLAELRVFGR